MAFRSGRPPQIHTSEVTLILPPTFEGSHPVRSESVANRSRTGCQPENEDALYRLFIILIKTSKQLREVYHWCCQEFHGDSTIHSALEIDFQVREQKSSLLTSFTKMGKDFHFKRVNMLGMEIFWWPGKFSPSSNTCFAITSPNQVLNSQCPMGAFLSGW